MRESNMFKDCIVLVSGAASGIGFEIARQFIEEGAIVIGADIDASALRDASEVLGDRFNGRLCDIGDIGQLERLCEQVTCDFDKLDILVNNAGLTPWAGPEELDVDVIDRCLAVNVRAPMLLVKHFAKLMRNSTNPSILNISSIGAYIDTPNEIVYGVSKAAIDKYTRTLARNLPGIRANTIFPGVIQTPVVEKIRGKEGAAAFAETAGKMAPVGRIGVPADIANCVLFLSSQKATYINGASIVIDGGISRAMGWM